MVGNQVEKLNKLNALSEHHYRVSAHFRNLVDRLFQGRSSAERLDELAYVPAELFKTHVLKSIPDDEIFKVMKSSGTTSKQRSQIFLDRDTARRQSKALSNIFSGVFGAKRLPMLIIDQPGQISNPATFSARGAGILGFSMFASKRFFALNDDSSINEAAVKEFLDLDTPRKCLFGFTAIIWEEFLEKIDIRNGKGDAGLLHGGGWKKLASRNISKQDFATKLMEKMPFVTSVHDYYGMVEQTGSIFMGCENGYLHTNEYNDIICRDSETLKVLLNGEMGVVQVLSVLPTSYPGFSILTEDLGTILGDRDLGTGCACGLEGKFFEIHGRIATAEVRGCSDTYRTV